MYLGPGPVGTQQPLLLSSVTHWTFDEGSAFPELDREYFKDMWRLYRLPWDDSLLPDRRNSFTDMLKVALRRLGPAAERIDLAVLANATPDVEPGYPMPYLQHVVGDVATAFAISDQGAAAPFTALRLVSGGLAAGPAGRALVVVMDQSVVPQGPAIPDRIRPLHDSTVIIVLARDGTLGTPVVRQFADVPDNEIGNRLRAEIVPGRTTVISQPELADHWLVAGRDVTIKPVKPGLPCTGLWAALAEHCRTWRGADPHRVVLADHDPELGYLNICRFDTATSAGRARGLTRPWNAPER